MTNIKSNQSHFTPFSEWVSKLESSDLAPLPSTHITYSVTAQRVIHEGFIRAQVDNKLTHHEELNNSIVYAFYGRPAYRIPESKVIQPTQLPICFILKPQIILSADAVYPFDTGAFINDRCNGTFGKEIKLSDYKLDSNCHIPNLVAKIWNSNLNYYNALLPKNTDPASLANPVDLYARAYLSLLSDRNRNAPDDRNAALELHCYRSIALDEFLQALIIPEQFYQSGAANATDNWIIKCAEELDVEICTYDCKEYQTRDYYYYKIEDAVKHYYNGCGYF